MEPRTIRALRVLLTALLAAMSPVASAAVITYYFGGVITEVNPNRLLPSAGVDEFPDAQVGVRFDGTISLDLLAYESRSDGLTSSVYSYGIGAAVFEVHFGQTVVRTDDSIPVGGPWGLDSFTEVSVVDNLVSGSQTVDAFHVFSQTRLPSGNWGGGSLPDGTRVPTAFLALDLFGAPADYFSSTSISAASAIDLEAFALRQFSIIGGFPNVFVRGEVDYLVASRQVSEPSALALVAVALFMLFLARRRRAVGQAAVRRHCIST